MRRVDGTGAVSETRAELWPELTQDSLGSRFRILREGEIGIDFETLKQKEDILFFDEAVLYQVIIKSTIQFFLRNDTKYAHPPEFDAVRTPTYDILYDYYFSQYDISLPLLLGRSRGLW